MHNAGISPIQKVHVEGGQRNGAKRSDFSETAQKTIFGS